MAGRTDAWILNDAAAAHGIPPDSPISRDSATPIVRHLAVELRSPASPARA